MQLFFQKKNRLKTAIVLTGLIIFIIAIALLHFKNPIHMAFLREKYSLLIQVEKEHPVLFLIALFMTYVVSICLVIPDSTLLSILTGTIYPYSFAVLFITVSETIGAICYFWIINYFFKDYIKKKKTKIIHGSFGKSYAQNDISYLLCLRISHILPFWLINIIAVVFKTKMSHFIWTAFFGSLPLSLILAQAGREFHKALISSTPFYLQSILDKPTELALLGLGVLTLSPILIKRFLKRG